MSDNKESIDDAIDKTVKTVIEGSVKDDSNVQEFKVPESGIPDSKTETDLTKNEEDQIESDIENSIIAPKSIENKASEDEDIEDEDDEDDEDIEENKKELSKLDLIKAKNDSLVSAGIIVDYSQSEKKIFKKIKKQLSIIGCSDKDHFEILEMITDKKSDKK